MGAHRIEAQRAARRNPEQQEQEHAALWVYGKGMDTDENARTHNKGADERECKCRNSEQYGPPREAMARAKNQNGMEQRRPREPRHKAHILHRVPHPPPAPAELVIGPETAERDTDGQKTPRRQNPRAQPFRPHRIDASFYQGRHRETKGQGKSDIAEIKKGRVKGEAGVLQNRVEPIAVHRNGVQPFKRVGGKEDKS